MSKNEKITCTIDKVTPNYYSLRTRLKTTFSQLKTFGNSLHDIKICLKKTSIPFVLERTNGLFKKPNEFDISYFEKVDDIEKRIHKNLENCIMKNANIVLNNYSSNATVIVYDADFIPIAYKDRGSYDYYFIPLNSKLKDNFKSISLTTVGHVIADTNMNNEIFYPILIGKELFTGINKNKIDLTLLYTPVYSQVYGEGFSKHSKGLEVLSFEAFCFTFMFLYFNIFAQTGDILSKPYYNTIYNKLLEADVLPFFTNDLVKRYESESNININALMKIYNEVIDAKIEEKVDIQTDKEDVIKNQVKEIEDNIGYDFSLSSIMVNPQKLHALNFLNPEDGFIFINPDSDIDLDGIRLPKEDILYIMVDDSYQMTFHVNFDTKVKGKDLQRLENALLHRLNIKCDILIVFPTG